MLLKDSNIYTPNGNTIIWRYMGLEKFLHLLISKQLFFSRLSRMTDKYEGVIPDELIIKRINQIVREQLGDPADILQIEKNEIEKQRNHTFLNCWTINRNESYALWKIYLKGSTSGIAIKSTISRLRKSLELGKEVFDFYIGQVNYENEILEYPPNKFQLTISKKPYYEFENELRVFFYANPELEKKYPLLAQSNGWNMNADISELIEKIYVSPFTGSWFFKSIKEVVQKTYPELTSLLISSEIKDQ